MTALEDKIIAEFKDGKASVERTLLAVSGLETEEAIYSYQRKLDFIQKDFERSCPERAGNYQTAKSLFDYLWETKPKRYNGDFLLAKVIDNQLDEDKDKTVGNCVGLTSLYSVLGRRLDLDMAVLASYEHFLTIFYDGERAIAVENVKRSGFDDVDALFKPEFRVGRLSLLVAETLNSRGYHKEDSGDLQGALADYNTAIGLEPDNAVIINNRGVIKYTSKDFNGALADYNLAIELKPDVAFAFNNRGNVKSNLGDFEGAIADYNKAIELDPDYVSPFNNRGGIKADLGDFNGAITDFNRAIELDPDDAYSFNNRATIKEELGDFEGALADYNRAIELKPDHFKAIHNKKRVLEMITSSKNI
ncbi:MAG: tetratricopeptide repeat protein [Nanoarchaeota archaeon]